MALVQPAPPGPSAPAGHPYHGAGQRGPLVVVAGLPGAGKSTALAQLGTSGTEAAGAGAGSAGAGAGSAGTQLVVLDSAAVRHWLRSRLGWIPYPVLRPVVHATHWARIVVGTLAEPRPLIVHETATRPISRWTLRALARCGRRAAHLVWIEVPAEVALRGQVDRRRTIRPRAFARHLRRVKRVDPVAAAQQSWHAVYRTDRQHAIRAIIVAGLPPHRPSSPAPTSILRG